MASLTVSQPRHPVVAGIEGKIFELMALVYEQVVDAHLLEIHHVVRAGFDGMFHLFQLGKQVDFTLLQSFEHPSRYLLALCPQNFQILFHRIQLLLQNLLLHVGRLGYLPELVVRHDDTIPIIIFDIVKELHPVLG